MTDDSEHDKTGNDKHSIVAEPLFKDAKGACAKGPKLTRATSDPKDGPIFCPKNS